MLNLLISADVRRANLDGGPIRGAAGGGLRAPAGRGLTLETGAAAVNPGQQLHRSSVPQLTFIGHKVCRLVQSLCYDF